MNFIYPVFSALFVLLVAAGAIAALRNLVDWRDYVILLASLALMALPLVLPNYLWGHAPEHPVPAIVILGYLITALYALRIIWTRQRASKRC